MTFAVYAITRQCYDGVTAAVRGYPHETKRGGRLIPRRQGSARRRRGEPVVLH